MNESQIERIGVQPLLDVIKEIIRLFPVRGSPYAVLQNLTALEEAGVAVMDSSSAIDKQALTQTLAFFSERGLDSLLSLGIVPNATDPAKDVLRIQPNTIDWISPQYYFPYENPDSGTQAVEMFTQISHHLVNKKNASCTQPLPRGSDENQWIDFAKDAIVFENLTWFHEVQQNSPETVDIEWLRNSIRSIDWPLLLPTIFSTSSSRTVKVEIARDVALEFDKMLENHGSPLAVQGYFVWKAIKQLIGLIAPSCQLPLVPAGSTENERWRYCARVLNSNLARIVRHFLVKKSLSENNLTAADDVAYYVRRAFINAYGSQGWLSCTDLADGIPKGNESIVLTGNDGSLNNSQVSNDLEDFYKDYKIAKKHFFRNQRRYADATDMLFKSLQCFREQHPNPSLSLLHISSSGNTSESWRLGERIAEYIALKQAFQAWKDSKSNISDTM
ncbi:hypothetical protein EC968_008910 [Mortierella alpina]|nr:hypothetical protein EC968_008910 [Mortierella alpina]